MQVVKYGKKGRILKVPVGWYFIRDSHRVQEGDMFFNLRTHVFEKVDEDCIGDIVGIENGSVAIAIRDALHATTDTCIYDRHAEKVITEVL